jgi:hypothetical protein
LETIPADSNDRFKITAVDSNDDAMTVSATYHEKFQLLFKVTATQDRAWNVDPEYQIIVEEFIVDVYDFCTKLRFNPTNSFYAGNTPDDPITLQYETAYTDDWTTMPVMELATECPVTIAFLTIDGAAVDHMAITLGDETDTAKAINLAGTFYTPEIDTDSFYGYGVHGFKFTHTLKNWDDTEIVDVVETQMWFNLTNPCIEDDQWASQTLTTVTH